MKYTTSWKLLRFVAAACLVHFTAQISLAVAILPGQNLFPATAEPDTGAGTLVYSTGPIVFNSPTLDGTLRSNVWTNDPSNPYGPNFLTFTYEVSAASDSPHDIARLAVGSFSNFLTDASYNPAAGVPPTVISRSLDGEVMGFSFISPALQGGLSASLLVVQTNATMFQSTIASVIDGTTANPLSVAPAIVPEPSTVCLAGLGLAGLFAAYRKRR